MSETVQTTDSVAPYVGGRRRDTDRSTRVTDLSSDDPFRTVSCTDQATAEAAVENAADAGRAIEATTIPQRAAWFTEIADGLRARRDELAEAIVRESGKPISNARAEVANAAERFDRIATDIHSLDGEYRTWTSPDSAGLHGLIRSAPLGVVVCRPSADSPLGTAAVQVAPALAVGNSVVLQPAKTAPVACSIFTDIVLQAGLPAPAIQFLPEPDSVASETLSTHAAVDAVVQSGHSSAVGHAGTGDGTVRLRMTLAGTTSAVVLDDAVVTDAATAIATGELTAPGHRSPGVPSVVAHESVSDDLVAGLDEHLAAWSRGPLFDTSTEVAPLPDRGRAMRTDELVTDAVDRGATIVRGGSVEGRYYEPTLLVDVPPDAKIHDERHGPVVAVTTVAGQDAAVSFIHERYQSRGPAVFTESHDRAMAVADAVDCREIRINGAPDRGPSGGIVGPTGSNAYGVTELFACFTRRKRVVH